MPLPPPRDPKNPGDLNQEAWKWMVLAMLMAAIAIGLMSANIGLSRMRQSLQGPVAWKAEKFSASVAGASAQGDGYELVLEDLPGGVAAEPLKPNDLPAGESIALEPERGREVSLGGVSVGLAMKTPIRIEEFKTTSKTDSKFTIETSLRVDPDAPAAHAATLFLVASRPGFFDVAQVVVIDRQGIATQPEKSMTDWDGRFLALGLRGLGPNEVSHLEISIPKKQSKISTGSAAKPKRPAKSAPAPAPAPDAAP